MLQAKFHAMREGYFFFTLFYFRSDHSLGQILAETLLPPQPPASWI